MAGGPGVMRHKSAAAPMDQTDISGLVTTLHVSVVEAASYMDAPGLPSLQFMTAERKDRIRTFGL